MADSGFKDNGGELPVYANVKLLVEDDDEPEIVEKKFTVSGSLLHQLGLWFPLDLTYLQHDLEMTSRTRKIRRMRFVDTADGTPIATLTNITVAATKGVDPENGRPWVYLGIDYYLTSHGYRTSEGPGLPGPLVVFLSFRNSADGIVWVRKVERTELRCGHNNHHVFYTDVDRHVVGWFDHWRKLTWDGWGTVDQC
ncbi:hypothetical protein [Streptomyces sp. NPDC057939]|uniref:hypothetical protein n=1 Tax=Streptomyces sp. NPDC057939 TaxID=3346284 RepID=UPI0036EF180F